MSGEKRAKRPCTSRQTKCMIGKIVRVAGCGSLAFSNRIGFLRRWNPRQFLTASEIEEADIACYCAKDRLRPS